VIEPLLGFGKRQSVRGDIFQEIRRWTSNTIWVREFSQQSTSQRIQNAPLVGRGVSFLIQVSFPIL